MPKRDFKKTPFPKNTFGGLVVAMRYYIKQINVLLNNFFRFLLSSFTFKNIKFVKS